MIIKLSGRFRLENLVGDRPPDLSDELEKHINIEKGGPLWSPPAPHPGEPASAEALASVAERELVEALESGAARASVGEPASADSPPLWRSDENLRVTHCSATGGTSIHATERVFSYPK